MIESLLPIPSLTSPLTTPLTASLVKSGSPVFQETFYPVGFPLLVSSSSESVLQAARTEWGAWSQSFDEPPIALNFEVSREICRLPAVSEFHAHDHHFAFV